MAEVLSDIVTDLDADPVVRQNAYNQGGFMRETIAVVVTAADESASNNLVMCPIPSNARVSGLALRHAEAGTTGQGNVGIMRKLGDGTYTFTGGDADLFASAYDFDDAGVATNAWIEIPVESGELTHAESAQQLWEALALTEDPHEDFFVAIDISEVFSSGPTSIAMRLRFVV
jgi:hypothetical protein